MDSSLTAALGVGFLLGLRHAMDADHVAAVSAIISDQRGVVRSCILGTFWGIGHTLTLLLAGLFMMGFKLTISAAVERALEMAVALVVILLGGHVLLRALSGVHVHRHAHVHNGSAHSHAHLHRGVEHVHDHWRPVRAGRKPFLVGMLHGMAGSGALMLLVLAALPSPGSMLLYILVFGFGSTAGMLLLSGLIGIPFAVTASPLPRAHITIQTLAGAGSLVFGLVMASRLAAG